MNQIQTISSCIERANSEADRLKLNKGLTSVTFEIESNFMVKITREDWEKFKNELRKLITQNRLVYTIAESITGGKIVTLYRGQADVD